MHSTRLDIDGVRLCKAKRFRYANCDMADWKRSCKRPTRPAARPR